MFSAGKRKKILRWLGEMKFILALGLLSVFHFGLAAVSPPEGIFASADGAFVQSTNAYGKFLQTTSNGELKRRR